MCGRFTAKLTWQQLHDLYEITAPEPRQDALDLKPRYNIAPSQTVPVVRLNPAGRRELAIFAPAFRAAFGKRRCLIPATGFYEWRKLDDGKQPYFIGMRDGSSFAFAGLWVRWDQGRSGRSRPSRS